MTIIELLKTEEEIEKENKQRTNREYRQNHPEKNNKYQRKFYRKNKDIILDKRAKYQDRKCSWCGKDISHLKPRHQKFCCPSHRKLATDKRKKEWYEKKMSKIQDMQHSDLPATE